MKIGIIGYGYWGKILNTNLKNYDWLDIVISDIALDTSKSLVDLLDRDAVFISVPFTEHFNLCKYFLSKGIAVFCEKPLADSLDKCYELYEIADKNNTYLFVDWLFMYNKEVQFIKTVLKKFNKNPISINMKRLNKGPIRTDTNALFDLLSHDISILTYLFDEKVHITNIINFKQNNSIQNDSCFLVGNISNTNIALEGSWEYQEKIRDCYFNFDNNDFIHWNDIVQKVTINNKLQMLGRSISPLQKSIETFIYGIFNKNINDLNYNKDITVKTMETLYDKI